MSQTTLQKLETIIDKNNPVHIAIYNAIKENTPAIIGYYDLIGDDGTTIFDINHSFGSIPSSIALFISDTTDPNLVNYSTTLSETKVTLNFSVAPKPATIRIYYQFYK